MADYDLNSLLEYADMMHVDREEVKPFHEYMEEEHKKKFITRQLIIFVF